jgi:RNA polymerase sigma factor (sigma-70 family)
MDARSELRRYLSQLLAPAEVARLSDVQLLKHYVGQDDANAFAALVHRHGPMVLGVCERVLGDAHAAEDAFQATFLVLVRSAASLVIHDSLSPWLYVVAYRTAIQARAVKRRHQVREHQKDGLDMLAQAAVGKADWQDVRPILDDELSRLPPRYRRLLVLHYLEGKSHRQMAHELQMASGSMSALLNRARNLLRSRLLRRGVLVSTAVLTVSMAQEATAAVPPKLAAATIKSATAFAHGAGVPLAGGSHRAIQLARAILRTRIAAGITISTLLLPLAVGVAALTTALEIVAHRNPPATQASVSGAVDAAHLAFALKDIQVRWASRLKTTKGAMMAVTIKNGGMAALVPPDHSADVVLWRFIDNEVPAPESFAHLQGHTARVLAATFSDDGNSLITGSQDATVRVWDIGSGSEQTTLAGHRLGIKAVALSKDGRLLASGGLDGAVKLWDLPTGNPRRALAGHRTPVHALAFSPDASLVASASQDGTIKLWETATGNARGVIAGHADIVNSLHFCNSGQKLASASADGTARVWDVPSRKQLEAFSGPEPNISLVRFSFDGTLLVTHSENIIRLWPLAVGSQGGPDSAWPEPNMLYWFVNLKHGRQLESWCIVRSGQSSNLDDGNSFRLSQDPWQPAANDPIKGKMR